MPSTYAHYRMGQEVRRQMKKKEKTIIENYLDLFQIGLHGPDILFYYHPLTDNSVNRVGFGLHEKSRYSFFERATKVVKEHGCDQAYLAYVYGVICHFALDVTCHGYVDEKIRMSGISHGEIEVEFDRELMVRDGFNPISHRLTNHIKSSSETANVIKDFYDGISETQVDKALKNMNFYNDLLLAPSRIKRNFIYALLKVSGNYKEMHGLIVNYKKNERCADSTQKLMELYETAKNLAVRLIQEYQTYMMGEADLDYIYNYTFGSKYVGEQGREEC